MDIAFDLSFTDWPVLGRYIGARDREWRERLWGGGGLEIAMDTILAAGVDVVNSRVHAPGPMWLSSVPETTPFNWGEFSARLGLSPSMAEWNMVEAAVEAAHRKGIKALGWFDLTEGHAGLPTAWAMNHPECCVVSRDGIRMDGPVGLVGRDGTRFDRTMVYMDHERLLADGFMDVQCLRPDGVPFDPQVSLAYPEVVEHRLALIDEVLDFGLDGIFLVMTGLSVGYEPPVSESFQVKYGIDPGQIAEDDPRWTEHQATFVTAFIRKVHEVIRRKEQTAGRKIEFILEGQGGFAEPGYQPPEIGWEHVPNWGSMPAFVDVDTIAREKLVDSLAFWTLRELEAVSDEVKRNVELTSRFRYWGAEFTEENYRARAAEAEKLVVSLFVINEVREALIRSRWIYPGEPGPLYHVARELGFDG